jgi:hypothetical protein
VADMISIRKTLAICFLALTIFSIFFLSYTTYLILETTKAGRSMTASISDINLKENASKASFLIDVYNPSNIRLALYFYEIGVEFEDDYVNKAVGYRHQPLPFPPNAVTNLNITVALDDETSYSNNGWILNVELMLRTPLPGRIIYTTVLEG